MNRKNNRTLGDLDMTEPTGQAFDSLPPKPKSNNFNHRLKLLMGLTVVLGALAFLGFTAFQSATVYFYTVSEIAEVGPTEEGRTVRVSGKLVPNSFNREQNSTTARFVLKDKDTEATLTALHDGVVPDLFFNDHSEIILEGKYGVDGIFHSNNVIVKCPSKYVAAE